MMPSEMPPDSPTLPAATLPVDTMPTATPPIWQMRPSAPSSQPRHVRTWPALVVLLFLPGMTAEMLTGSTPVLVYLTNPINLIINTLIYGSGAILIREVARRRGLGWPNILLLGAAYGIFEEGLVVNTWASPWATQVCAVSHGVATGLCDYSRVAGINLLWAVSLTTFHAVISITVPILLVELLFSQRAPYPWLGRKSPKVFVGAEVLILAFGLLVNFVSFRQHHQAAPPVGPYLLEGILMTLFIVLGLTRAPSGARASAAGTRAAPRLWTLRIVAFLGLAITVFLPYVLKGIGVPFGIVLAIYAVLIAVAVWRARAWSRRAGWGTRHRLALASGALGFLLIVVDPVLEATGEAGGNATRGTIVVALAYVVLLIVLARRVGRRAIAPTVGE